MFILKMVTLLTLLTFITVGQKVRRCKQMEAGVGKVDIQGDIPKCGRVVPGPGISFPEPGIIFPQGGSHIGRRIRRSRGGRNPGDVAGRG